MKRRSGGLLLALVVPAVFGLSGCGLFSSSSSSPSSSAGADGAAGAGGDSWIVSEQGKATPSPKPTSGGTPPPSVSFGFLPLNSGGGAQYATPTPVCSPNMFNFSKIAGLDVTPAATTAVLNWYNVGGINLVEFRLYAISQDLVVGDQRDVTYTVVKPKTPCGQMSATITNLSPKTHYVFTVDAVVLRRSGDGTHSATVFRSHSLPTL
ncbi:hypothetical protein [Actinoplanes sp. NPDC089786]|uniref:hypothetical protein n=1 Tax=Actinoplanes sp. NPDC089786 TaxID=3155185 RepID=UPI003425FEAA